MAQTLDLNVINKTLEDATAALKAIREAGIPKQEPRALNEPRETNKPTTDYRTNVVKALKDTSQTQKDFGETWEQGIPTKELKRDLATPEGAKPFSEAIGGVSGTAAIPTIWAADVFRCCPYPASAFYGNPNVLWHEDLHGKPGGTLNVVTVGKIYGGTAMCTEPDSTAPTVAMTYIPLEEYHCPFYICRSDLEDMVEDTVTALNESLAECIDQVIDSAFIANLIGKGKTLDHGTNIIDPAWIAENIGSMRNGTCEPVWGVMHPVVESRLMRNSQFVSAATFGDRSVISGGHITRYLGIDFVVLPLGSLVSNAPGTYRTFIASRHAIHAAKKRDPVIESQYMVKEQKRYVDASVRFGKEVVCNDGLWWLLTAA